MAAATDSDTTPTWTNDDRVTWAENFLKMVEKYGNPRLATGEPQDFISSTLYQFDFFSSIPRDPLFDALQTIKSRLNRNIFHSLGSTIIEECGISEEDIIYFCKIFLNYEAKKPINFIQKDQEDLHTSFFDKVLELAVTYCESLPCFAERKGELSQESLREVLTKLYFDRETTGLSRETGLTDIAKAYNYCKTFISTRAPIPEEILEAVGIFAKHGREHGDFELT